MLDLKYIRENPETVRAALNARRMEADLDGILKLDARRREFLSRAEELKRVRNAASREIGEAKKRGEEGSARMAEMKELSGRIRSLDGDLKEVEEELGRLLLRVPNIPHPDVPDGTEREPFRLVREEGAVRDFDFSPRDHLEIVDTLQLADLPRAARISGSNFPLLKGDGALLSRALVNFMLDLHTSEHGYLEISPPVLCSRDCLVGTGQLPKLEDDMYHLDREDLFLIPTGEVPLTNLYRGEILEDPELPLRLVAVTACFRREAGSYGKDTRGLIRLHQFDKVELVKFTRPEESWRELESLLADAEKVLAILKIPYRVIELPASDLSFASARCYDIEAWAPGQNEWLEVSSCSNFADFQARRSDIRFRDGAGKVRHPHTLNASGLALPRTIVALLENYQRSDGTVEIPAALRPYLHGRDTLSAPL